jgi:hypothetical protein
MTTPTPEEQAKLMAGWDEAVAARTEAGYAKAAAIKAASGLASNKTLRDEFAGRAMQGILSGMDLSTMPPYEEFGPFCYRLADAMLKARKTTGGGEA